MKGWARVRSRKAGRGRLGGEQGILETAHIWSLPRIRTVLHHLVVFSLFPELNSESVTEFRSRAIIAEVERRCHLPKGAELLQISSKIPHNSPGASRLPHTNRTTSRRIGAPRRLARSTSLWLLRSAFELVRPT